MTFSQAIHSNSLKLVLEPREKLSASRGPMVCWWKFSGQPCHHSGWSIVLPCRHWQHLSCINYHTSLSTAVCCYHKILLVSFWSATPPSKLPSFARSIFENIISIQNSMRLTRRSSSVQLLSCRYAWQHVRLFFWLPFAAPWSLASLEPRSRSFGDFV